MGGPTVCCRVPARPASRTRTATRRCRQRRRSRPPPDAGCETSDGPSGVRVDFGRHVRRLHLETVKMRAPGSTPRSRSLPHPVVRVAGVISCVYCGGAHARPADVRQCWAEHSTPALPLESEPQPVPYARASGWHGGRGPTTLGRHALVGTGAPEPAGWEGCRRVVIDAAVIESPDAVVSDLRRAAADSQSLVIELRARFDDPPREVDQRPQHLLGPGHAFWLDEL